ncbi:ATP-binding protein [uncultured Methanolobus sp.]|uniref:ATP-binding protein n=1 Tax=uncultured Methanolobus sp. TaxID=218300 RepID=UPI002AAB4807|nr:ATP-binding protein [uncultured Methanolobus sp.]
MSASTGNVAGSVLPLMLQNAGQDLFTRLNIGIIYLDEHNRLLCSNKVVRDLTGFVAEELFDENYGELCCDSHYNNNSLSEFFLSTRPLYEERSCKFRITDKKGNFRYLLCDVFPFPDNCKSKGGKICILRADAIHGPDENDFSSEEHNDEHKIENMYLREKVLSKLGEKTLSCSNINSLMDYALKLVAKALDVKYSLIMERLQDGQFLLRYGYGLSEWCIGSALVEKETGSPSGYTAFTGSSLVVEDMRTEERFFVPRFLHEHNIVSGVAVIIGDRKDMYGVMCIYTDNQRKFTEHDVNFLQSIANILAEKIKLRDSFKSLELYRNLINQSSDYIMVLNAVTKKFIYVSNKVFHDLGFTEAEILGQDIFDPGCFINGHDMHEHIGNMAEDDDIVVEFKLMAKDGSLIPVEISFSFVEDAGTTYIVLIGRDISERHILELAIKERARQLEYSNEIKNLFADITSHDLINSISLIEGFSGYLKDMETDEEKKHLLGHIVSSTARLKKTIDSATVFARLNSTSDMSTEEIDLLLMYYGALERILEKISEKGINVKLDSPRQCNALVNPIIEEVFYNLLSNAIKYSPQGGTIIVNIAPEDSKWKVSISDEGPGISDEDKKKIFGRFRRADASHVSGHGLGLAIARMALKCHGEEIYVEDNGTGVGTTFCFTVQAAGMSES